MAIIPGAGFVMSHSLLKSANESRISFIYKQWLHSTEIFQLANGIIVFHDYKDTDQRLYVEIGGARIDAALPSSNVANVGCHANSIYFTFSRKVYEAQYDQLNYTWSVTYRRDYVQDEHFHKGALCRIDINESTRVYRMHSFHSLISEIKEISLADLILTGVHRDKVFYTPNPYSPLYLTETPFASELNKQVIKILLPAYNGTDGDVECTYSNAKVYDLPHRFYASDSSPIVYFTNGSQLFALNTDTLTFLPPLTFSHVTVMSIAGIHDGIITVRAGMSLYKDKCMYLMNSRLPDKYVQGTKSSAAVIPQQTLENHIKESPLIKATISEEMKRETDLSLNDLRLREEAAERQLQELRDKRREMERVEEIEKKKQDERRRKIAAEQRAIAFAQLKQAKQNLVKQREETEKELAATELQLQKMLQTTEENNSVDDRSTTVHEEYFGINQEQLVRMLSSTVNDPDTLLEIPQDPNVQRQTVDSSVKIEKYEVLSTKQSEPNKNAPAAPNQQFHAELEQRMRRRAQEMENAKKVNTAQVLPDSPAQVVPQVVKLRPAKPAIATYVAAAQPPSAPTPPTPSPTPVPQPPPPPPILCQPITPVQNHSTAPKGSTSTSNDERSNLFSEILAGKFTLKTIGDRSVEPAKSMVTTQPPKHPSTAILAWPSRPRPPVAPKPSRVQSTVPSAVTSPSAQLSGTQLNQQLGNESALNPQKADDPRKSVLLSALEAIKQRVQGPEEESEEENDDGDEWDP